MIVVDNFAGGGGASLGIEQALGRSIDIAVNHDAKAVAMHKANRPRTEHHVQDVWSIDPAQIAARGRVGLVWFSPDCTHYSRAKGGRPIRRKDRRSRDLAWVAVRWAQKAAPDVMMLENVPEFLDWGPLDEDGRPIRERKGETFRLWTAALKRAGYALDWRLLRACDFGAPTVRTRLFVVMRRDGLPIAWPEPSHGPGLLPYRTAAECIDWSVPVHSIFLTKEEARRAGVRRPLAEKTMSRIARGVYRYVIDAARPFIVPVTHVGDVRSWSIDEPLRTVTCAARGEFALVAPWMAQHNGGMTGHSLEEPVSTIVQKGCNQNLVTCLLSRQFGSSTGQPLDEPAPTVMPRGGGKSALVAAFLSNQHGSNRNGGQGDLLKPANTVMAKGQHKALVTAFLLKYYSTNTGSALSDPAPTVTVRDRLGLVVVDKAEYRIVDIGMRMLTARELFRAQGFPDSYRIDVECNGKPLSKTAQIRMCGNSVSPHPAAALVAANFRSMPERKAA